MPERDRRGLEETGRGLPHPPPGLFHPSDSSSYKSAHHYLRCTQVWVTAGLSFGTKAVSENTQIVWMIIIGFFGFFRRVWMCIVLFVLRLFFFF